MARSAAPALNKREIIDEAAINAGSFKVFRKIRLKAQREDSAALIIAKNKLSPVTARALAARGFEVGDVLDAFLSPTLKTGLPHPDKLKNLNAACDLIAEIVAQKKSVAICCDFDVDGVTGGAQVFHFLRTVGALVQVFTPDRFADGYGLNIRQVEDIAQAGFALLLTIDFGTTNQKELARARELGLKTIVVDHHHVGDHQPGADVFVNPQQLDCRFADGLLCAAGLAWYLVLGLSKRITHHRVPDTKEYLDLACIGTICDMVPLIGANRVLAKRGLELLQKSTRPGLIALKELAGVKKDIQCSHVSFGIGPRINAAGRMVHAQVVLELLTTSDSVRAGKIARDLNTLNSERQQVEAGMKEEAVKLVQAGASLPHGIVVWKDDFHTGVIGIVAQRLVEEFYRPAAVLGVDNEEFYKGSMRSIKGVSAVGLLEKVKKHLVKFGGHEGAAGFSLKRSEVEAFRDSFDRECRIMMEQIDISPYVEADVEASLADVSVALVNELQGLAPFGMGNSQPTLLFRRLKVVSVSELKKAHLKISFSDGKQVISALFWRMTEHPELKIGNIVDVAARPDINTYGGMSGLQLTLQAVQKAG